VVSSGSAGGRLPLGRGGSIWPLGSCRSAQCCLGRLAALCRLRCEAYLVRSPSFYPYSRLGSNCGGGGSGCRLAHWLPVAMVCACRWPSSIVFRHHDDIGARRESTTGLLGIRRRGGCISAGGEFWLGLTRRCSQLRKYTRADSLHRETTSALMALDQGVQ
jgi:hypothetical protein